MAGAGAVAASLEGDDLVAIGLEEARYRALEDVGGARVQSCRVVEGRADGDIAVAVGGDVVDARDGVAGLVATVAADEEGAGVGVGVEQARGSGRAVEDRCVALGAWAAGGGGGADHEVAEPVAVDVADAIDGPTELVVGRQADDDHVGGRDVDVAASRDRGAQEDVQRSGARSVEVGARGADRHVGDAIAVDVADVLDGAAGEVPAHRAVPGRVARVDGEVAVQVAEGVTRVVDRESL